MDEDELLSLRDKRGRVPAEAVGQYLAATDWWLVSQTAELALTVWRCRYPEAPEIRLGERYVIDGHPGGRAVAVLAVVIPDDPDHPSPADWFGLWQVRQSGRPAWWLLVDNLWIDSESVTPVD